MVGPVGLTLAPGPLSAPVLARVIRAVAAQAGVDIDRLNDATLAAEAVASSVAALGENGPLRATVTAHQGGVRLRVGPLPEGAGRRVYDSSALPGLGPILDGVADEVSFEKGDDGDVLTLVVGRRP